MIQIYSTNIQLTGTVSLTFFFFNKYFLEEISCIYAHQDCLGSWERNAQRQRTDPAV